VGHIPLMSSNVGISHFHSQSHSINSTLHSSLELLKTLFQVFLDLLALNLEFFEFRDFSA